MVYRVLSASLAISLALPGLARADGHSEQVERLYEALQMPAILGVMRQEGLGYGEEIATELFPGPPPSDWAETVSEIYATDRIEAGILNGLNGALSDADIEAMIAFFETPLGAQIASLEVDARRARLDPDVEEAADESAMLAVADETPRFLQIERFVDTNDLVETNVVAAMNFSYEFYQGLAQGGALGGDFTDDQILSDVWSQEPEIRASTTEWVYSFLLMAYQPLEDDDVEAYITFSETEAGQDMNRALIAAFDATYAEISRALGLAAAEAMTTQEL